MHQIWCFYHNLHDFTLNCPTICVELKVAVEVAVVYEQKQPNMSDKRRYLYAYELTY